MMWQSWSDFWAMGGSGAFVWGSYGITLIAIVVELLQLFYRRRDCVRRLVRWRRAQPDAATPAAATSSYPSQS